MRQAGPALASKRAADVTVAGAGLLLASPVLLVVALLIKARMGSPVLFRQVRPGRDARPFTLAKFRTMLDARSPDGSLLPDSERLTSLGRFLRASSLDELPQLWNVLRGDMSLVGPRPLLTAYLRRYSKRQARRHEVLPGITGWAQVKGRNALSWPEKFDLDVWYVDHWSPWLDLSILGRTLIQVLRRADISREGHATMPEFLGEEGGPR